MNEFKIPMEFNFYDIMMLSQMIAHARRYGDNQVSDWAGEFRDRMNEAANPDKGSAKRTLLELQPTIEGEAKEVLKAVGEQTAVMPEVRPETPKPSVIGKKPAAK